MNEKWFRRLWTVNGILLFATMGIALFVMIRQIIGPDWDVQEAPVQISTARQDTVRPRAVRMSNPHDVFGTSTRLVELRYGERQVSRLLERYEASGFDGSTLSQPVVNVLFLQAGGTSRLLLDRAAYIRAVYFPQYERESLQTWIAYEIALDDTNGDRQLDPDDDLRLYITDLDGVNLRSVLPPGNTPTWHGPGARRGELLVHALTPVPESTEVSDAERIHRAYAYDVATSTLTELTAVNRLIDSAARVLAR